MEFGDHECSVFSGNCDDHVEIAAIFDHDSEDVSVLGEPKIVWKCNVAPDGSENYYRLNFEGGRKRSNVDRLWLVSARSLAS